MISKHCLACGRDAHPRTRHPSSLRAELTIWALALAIGTMAGLWSAATSPARAPLSQTVQAMALSAVQAPDAGTPPADEAPATPASGSQTLGWAMGLVLAFLRSAWWVLPIPFAFSIWRQVRTYPVCRTCGSRNLTALATTHGALPPAF